MADDPTATVQSSGQDRVTDSAATYRNQRLNELAALAQNWDSYGAPPLTEAALRTADALVFVPTGEGGVQIELHASGQDFEVTIGPDGRVEEIWLSRAAARKVSDD